MATEYVYRENVPVCIDGVDFGITCTLVRDRDVHYGGIPEQYGLVAFTEAQAQFLANLVNSSDDDYLQGSFGYDAATDTYTEYSDDGYEGDVLDAQAGFLADGVKLYCLGSNWCWSLGKED